MLTPQNWLDYELVDSGGGGKLERWGPYLVARPEPRAIWRKSDPEVWKKADASFKNNVWEFLSPPPTEWQISYIRMKFLLKPTDFKHTGVFPEQATNWDWLEKIIGGKDVKVLNLFAYTGGATMAAANAGAYVTHVDSSRPAMMWASENARLTGIPKEKIRWIQDDALKFVRREQRRGVKYDGIILDPPKFGHGAGGKIWKLEDNLPELVWECNKILSPTPNFFLLNAYTVDLSSQALGNLLNDVLENRVEFGELGLKESSKRGYILPAGIFARWSS
jgi:23S rRNA (cytosine1962-C5)-methyltransferase